MSDTRIEDFTLPSTGGDFTLSAASRPLVIYFYPKDSTPGCTTESAAFRDLHAEFTAAGATVVGISRDSLKSHQNFKSKLELPFELLSDPDETACELFGVMKMKNMYGKQVRGVERSTFVIGADDRILREWRGVKVPGHAEEVLAFIRTL
ncbi:MAG: peroxiredoxin [Methyloversatilis sp.]|uniref:thioredoxin-dependent peroxiredoxin n=1 Tax=Methyloversatilis universalis (strain ATCC BAA-1314 / DSM 25237 / JCM 13912 / CCUG 52030 / FAM5) TaxID=1000565 RepID=F5R8X6_METUF|nr:peroxiredoxin [Methyloversatilis universalis]EGK72943.1 Putative peroxiredoxin Bcp [Methyloversatilis universalis FAM5]MCP4636248.1 peroxiredoxin [Methyloversatilis sp.]